MTERWSGAVLFDLSRSDTCFCSVSCLSVPLEPALPERNRASLQWLRPQRGGGVLRVVGVRHPPRHRHQGDALAGLRRQSHRPHLLGHRAGDLPHLDLRRHRPRRRAGDLRAQRVRPGAGAGRVEPAAAQRGVADVGDELLEPAVLVDLRGVLVLRRVCAGGLPAPAQRLGGGGAAGARAGAEVHPAGADLVLGRRAVPLALAATAGAVTTRPAAA